jgi:hypothetical protein
MQSITTFLIEHPHIGQQTDVAGIRRVRHAARDPSGAPRRA